MLFVFLAGISATALAAPPPAAPAIPLAPVTDTAVYPGTSSPTTAAPPAASSVTDQASPDFPAWLAGYRNAALARGVSPTTLDSVLAGLTPSPRVIELDRSQPGDSGQAPARFDAYLARRLDSARIAGGLSTATRLKDRLAAIESRTGVPAAIILGIWGMETNYGRITGDFDVTRSLATLAWDGRRRQLFTKELDAIVTIVERGLASRATLRGSWAGAMGQPQFLPSSYLAYAADGDGDGRIDIWNSDLDTAASIASYLEKHGWKRGISWGQSVSIPAEFNRETVRNPEKPVSCVKPLERHSRWITASEWKRMGVTSASPLPADTVLMSLVEPDGPGQGAYLTTANYRVLMDYNCSNFYALSVALLGDAVAPATR